MNNISWLQLSQNNIPWITFRLSVRFLLSVDACCPPLSLPHPHSHYKMLEGPFFHFFTEKEMWSHRIFHIPVPKKGEFYLWPWNEGRVGLLFYSVHFVCIQFFTWLCTKRCKFSFYLKYIINFMQSVELLELKEMFTESKNLLQNV